MRPFTYTLTALFVCGSGCQFNQTVDLSSIDKDAAQADADPTAEDASSALADADPAAPDAMPPPQLVDRGLVIRYFMDEAASGTGPSDLVDSAPSPLALPISYGQASYVEEGGNKGLRWPSVSGNGVAQRSLSGTKILNGLTASDAVTIEVVIDIDDAGGDGQNAQIAGLRGGNPDFMLKAQGNSGFRFFRPYGPLGALWENVHSQERMVLHLVYNANDPTPDNRIRLYKDGVLAPKTTSSPPQPGDNPGLGGGDFLVIGNGQSSPTDSILGTIYYVAMYKEALNLTEITNNHARLIVNDDQ